MPECQIMSIGWQILYTYKSVVFCIHVSEENNYESILRHNFGLLSQQKEDESKSKI